MRNKEKAEEWRRQYREKHREEFVAAYEERKAKGLCTACGKVAIPGKTLCAIHEEYHHKYREAHKEKQHNYDAARYRADPDASRNGCLLNNYGITIEEYNELFIKQGGRCAICGRHQSELRKHLFVDHEHTTGAVRGLLCNKCNFGIGYFQDNDQLLLEAAKYLNGARGEQ